MEGLDLLPFERKLTGRWKLLSTASDPTRHTCLDSRRRWQEHASAVWVWSSSRRSGTFVESGDGAHSRGPGNPVRRGHPTAAERVLPPRHQSIPLPIATDTLDPLSLDRRHLTGVGLWLEPMVAAVARAWGGGLRQLRARGCFMESRRAIVRVQASTRWKG